MRVCTLFSLCLAKGDEAKRYFPARLPVCAPVPPRLICPLVPALLANFTTGCSRLCWGGELVEDDAGYPGNVGHPMSRGFGSIVKTRGYRKSSRGLNVHGSSILPSPPHRPKNCEKFHPLHELGMIEKNECLRS